MTSYDLDKYFPLKGTCFHCGKDLRHKTLDSISQRFASGESANTLAIDYNVPVQAIELVVRRYSTTPLGIALSEPKVRSAAA